MAERGLTPKELTSHSATFLFVALYIMVAAAATTHEDLLRGTRVTLPLLDVGVPVLGFFIFAPLFVVALHLNLLLRQYLVIFRLTLGRLPGVTSQWSRHPAHRSTPDPLQVLFLASESQPAPRWLIRNALHFVYLALFAVLPVAVLLTVQVRFVPYHHEVVTLLHQALVFCDVAAVLVLLTMILAPRSSLRRAWSIDLKGRDTIAFASPVSRRRVQDRMVGWFRRREANRLIGVLRRHAAGRALWSGLVYAVLWPCYRWLKFLGVIGAILVLIPAFCVLVPPGHPSEVRLLSEWLDGHPRIGLRRNLNVVGKDLSNGAGQGARSSDTVGNGRSPSLRRGLDLSYRDLRFADLRDNDLSGALFSGADLRGAQLSGSALVGADFSSRDQRQTDLSRADLSEVDLSAADLRDAVLVQARLREASGRSIDLRFADLRFGDLREVRFVGLDGRQALFDRTDLSRSSIWGSSFDGAMLVGADLSEAELVGASFRHADLAGARFVGSNLRLSDFMTARVVGAELRAARLEWAVGMEPQAVHLQGARLDGVDFRFIGFYLDGAYVVSSESHGCDLVDLRDIVASSDAPGWENLKKDLRAKAEGTKFWASVNARITAAEVRSPAEACWLSSSEAPGLVLYSDFAGAQAAASETGTLGRLPPPAQDEDEFWASFADRLVQDACESAEGYLAQVLVERAMGCLTPRIPELERVLMARLGELAERSRPPTPASISASETGGFPDLPEQTGSCQEQMAELEPFLRARAEGRFLEDFECELGATDCRSVQLHLCPQLFMRTRRPSVLTGSVGVLERFLRFLGIHGDSRWRSRDAGVTGG